MKLHYQTRWFVSQVFMLSLVSNFPVNTVFSQPAIVIYGYRSELLAQLIAYLTIISTIIWLVVFLTHILRLGARRRYKSVRRLQGEVKKRSAYH
jgi:hypothetical protein